jgi:hypothetical protein
MSGTVRQVANRGANIGFDVTTTDTAITPLVSVAKMAQAGANHINGFDAFVTGGPCVIFPSYKSSDLLASDCNASATAVVTTVANFAVGDVVYLYDPTGFTSASYETAVIKSIDTGTSTLTFHAAVTNSYATINASVIAVIGSVDGWIPIDASMSYSKDGLKWGSVAVRKMSAVNVHVRGTALVI